MNSVPEKLPIVDSFGRRHNSLRISITDRCNIRCFYCMPEVVRFLPRHEVLTFEEIERVVAICAGLGVDKIRLTGGEPLVRSQVSRLVKRLIAVEGIEEVAMTTNGLLLAEQAQELKEAGLSRLNVSLDTINPEVFEQVTRRKGLEKVLAGIKVAQAVGFERIRINAVSIKGISETEIVPLATFAGEHGLELRFIEFMPLDGDDAWDIGKVLTGSDVRKLLEKNIGPLKPVNRLDLQQPAVDYQFLDRPGVIGFIDSVSQPFCGSCNRMRITAEGKFRNCLFSTVEWDVRELLRNNATDQQIEDRIRQCIMAKKAGHGSDSRDFVRPEKAMYQIGG